jgi:Flp pilus assembly protein CpaB
VALKRSNRLILLIGIVLAIVAFVAIIFLFNGPGTGTSSGPTPPPTEFDTVIASVDIPLGTQVRSDMLVVRKVAVASRLPGVVGDPSEVVGQIVRTNVPANAQLTSTMFASTGLGQNPAPLLEKGLRAISVQVDQVSGVGTLISVGDRVDAVVGFGGGSLCQGREFTLVVIDKTTGEPKPIQGLSDNTTKLLLQNMQVVGTLLPPVEQPAQAAQGSPAPTTGGGTALNGQQEIVVLAVNAQQAEVIKYAQLNGCLSLILRSPKDYLDDAGQPTQPKLDSTTGIIMKTLVDEYGVLPPQIVEAILPKK